MPYHVKLTVTDISDPHNPEVILVQGLERHTGSTSAVPLAIRDVAQAAIDHLAANHVWTLRQNKNRDEKAA